MFRFTLVFVALLTAGCVSLDPNYERPAAPVPATLPGSHGEATAVVSDWQQVVNDARLKKVVNIALTSNRDVQKALADIEAARAQFGETRASLFPTLDAELSHTRSKTVASGLTSSAEADGAVSSFELDLFGKNQSLTRAARETWLASEFTAQNTRLTMIADLTTAWITLAADNSNLALAVNEMDGKKLARAAPISALALFRLCSASWISGRRSSTDEETPAGTRVILRSPRLSRVPGSRLSGTVSPASRLSAFLSCATSVR